MADKAARGQELQRKQGLAYQRHHPDLRQLRDALAGGGGGGEGWRGGEGDPLAVAAAVQLLQLSEAGDEMAAGCVLQHYDRFLAALTRSGLFRGKLRSASETLRGFLH